MKRKIRTQFCRLRPPKILLTLKLGLLLTTVSAYGGGFSGETDINVRLTVGGETSAPIVTIGNNVGLHPNSPNGTVVFTVKTSSEGTRQGVKIDSVTPPAGSGPKTYWSLQLTAPGAMVDDDGYTYSEPGPTTYSASLQTTGPIEPGDYTVKIETLWIY